MDLTWLLDFEALAETGNFSRAAEARHVTQPAFSRRIRSLEDWAGTALFVRARQPIVLTEAGQRLRPLLADIARRLEVAREEAGAVAAGSLRFAATHALSFSFFPAWLGALDRPPGAIQLISDGLEACERLMLAGRAEFLLCHHHAAVPSRLDGPNFLSRRIGRDRLVLLSAPEPRGTARFSATDPQVPMLAYGAGSGLARIVATLAPPLGRPVFTAHLAAALLTMVREGQGIAWLPESLAAPDLAASSLVPAAHAPSPIPLDIRMFRAAGLASRTALAFWTGLPAEDVA